jgi:paraquat-inducible protein B
MSKKANPAAIGAFVLAAMTIAAVALAVLGTGKLFKEAARFVMFFDSSLSGLDVGAPVECRGVRVGSVTRILLQYDTADGTLKTPVYINLEPDRMQFTGPHKRGRGMDYHIQHGMRAQLQAQSLITGKLKIMLVDEPDSKLRLVGGDPDTPEIPTIPMLKESIVDSIEALPLADIVRNLNKSMESIAALTSSGELTNALARLNGVLQNVDILTSNVNQRLPNVLAATQKNADQFLQVQSDISAVLGEIKRVMTVRSPERQQTIMTMRSMEEAAVALRDLLAYLQLHPEAILTGKKEN